MPRYTLDPGPIEILPIDLTPPGRADGGFTGLVGQALADLGGVHAALDDLARPVVDASGGNPDAELTPHEATIVTSQRRDRATMGELYAVDELAAGDAVDLGTDGAARVVADVQDAHRGLSPRIDEGRGEIPVEPDGLPDDLRDHPRDWPHPPKDAESFEPHR